MAIEELKVVISADTNLEGFERAEEAIKEVGEATEEASKKMKTISEVVDEQSEQLKELRQKYVDLAAAGEHDWTLAQEIQDITKELEANKKAIADAEKQLQKYDGSMDTIAKAAAQQEAELKSLKDQYIEVVAAEGKNSDSARQLAGEIKELSGELKDNKKAIADAEDEYNKLDATMKDSKKQFEDFSTGFNKIGDAAKTGLKVAAGAVAGVTTAFLALGPTTQEYRQNQAQLNAAFEQAKLTTESATATYQQLFKVIGDDDQSVESAANIAMLASSEQEAAKWAELASGVLGTFHDTLQPEAFYEAANETLKLGEATGAFAQMLEQTGVMSVEEFNAALAECGTEAEKQALMLKVSGDAMGEAGKSYDEATASIQAQREAQANMSAVLAELGAVAEPIVTLFAEFASDVLADLTPHIKEFAETALPKVKEVLTEVGEKLGDVFTWISDNWEFVSTIAAIVLGVATAISVLSTGLTAYNAVMAITSAVSLPIIGTIAAVVAGIALLVAGIVLAVKHWDEITVAVGNFVTKVGDFFSGLGESISEWVSGIGESISNWWSETTQGFTDWWSGIGEGWTDFWSGVGTKISDGVQAAKDKFQEMKDGISEKVSDAKTKVTDKFQEIKDGIGSKVEAAKTTVKDKYESIKTTMTNAMETAKGNVQEKLDRIKKAYTDNGGGVKGIVSGTMEGVKSLYQSGYNIIDNLTGGKLTAIKDKFTSILTKVVSTVREKFDNIKSAITTKFNAAKDTISDIIEKIKGFFNFKITWPKIPMPHFSVSPAGWSIGDLLKGEIPKLSIDWYAQGGVFDKPTLFNYNGQLGGLGEDGAEAIVPLEKNTYWLDRIATMLSEKTNFSQPIVLQVDGKVFAQTAISTMNDLTRQTGKLNLVMI